MNPKVEGVMVDMGDQLSDGIAPESVEYAMFVTGVGDGAPLADGDEVFGGEEARMGDGLAIVGVKPVVGGNGLNLVVGRDGQSCGDDCANLLNAAMTGGSIYGERGPARRKR